jgi:hypothetical protein
MDKYVIEVRMPFKRWREMPTVSGERKLFETATEAQIVFDSIPHNRQQDYRIRVIPIAEE